MKMTHWMVIVLSMVTGLDALKVAAQDIGSPPESAASKIGVVAGDRVNLRGQATTKSEVVTQLQSGDRVTILEQVTTPGTGGGAPETWYRVKLPESVPVWVHSSFINPDSLTVKASRLNMRKGPGENFSVLGQLKEGEVIKVIETKGDWIKIEAPENAFAYVAAYLVTVTDKAPALVATPPEPAPAAVSSAQEPALATGTTETVSAIESEPPPLMVEELPPGPDPLQAPNETNDIPSILSEPLVVNVDTNLVAPPGGELSEELSSEALEVEGEPEAEPEVPKRLVYREGIVKRSSSIQAPTYFILANPYNGRTINYLHSPSNNIVLQDYYGARVLVKGEEMMDERWRKTPVITIETLETVP